MFNVEAYQKIKGIVKKRPEGIESLEDVVTGVEAIHSFNKAKVAILGGRNAVEPLTIWNQLLEKLKVKDAGELVDNMYNSLEKASQDPKSKKIAEEMGQYVLDITCPFVEQSINNEATWGLQITEKEESLEAEKKDLSAYKDKLRKVQDRGKNLKSAYGKS